LSCGLQKAENGTLSVFLSHFFSHLRKPGKAAHIQPKKQEKVEKQILIGWRDLISGKDTLKDGKYTL
jgi:hypothetical protein